MDNITKKFRRAQIHTSQMLGRSERTDVLQEVQTIEYKLDRMINAVEQTKDKVADYVNRSKSGSDSVEKRKSKLKDAAALENTLSHHAHEMTKDGSDDLQLLGYILGQYATTVSSLARDQANQEIDVESKVLERFAAYTEEYKEIHSLKEKLKRQVLDYDSARKRLHQVQNNELKDKDMMMKAQDECDSAQNRLAYTKDNLVANMHSLASKEIEIASLFAVLVELQRGYHQAVTDQLSDLLPLIHRKIATYPYRPVFGCALEDHLRYANRSIALVLEVCCAALIELGLTEEGLFRISGNAIRIRKLKACLDAGHVDLADYTNDPHSIAGVLKSYLRELPDPLMTHALYNQWLRCASIESIQERQESIKHLLTTALPPPHYDNLRYLIKFLSKLLENVSSTKMSAHNLAVVIGPNVLWTPTGDNVPGCILVETMIEHANYFFTGEVDFSSSLIGSLIDQTGGFPASASAGTKLRMGSGSRPFDKNSDMHGSNTSLQSDNSPPNSTVKKGAGDPSNTSTQRAPLAGANIKRPKTAAPPPPSVLANNQLQVSANQGLYPSIEDITDADVSLDLQPQPLRRNASLSPRAATEKEDTCKVADSSYTADTNNAGMSQSMIVLPQGQHYNNHEPGHNRQLSTGSQSVGVRPPPVTANNPTNYRKPPERPPAPNLGRPKSYIQAATNYPIDTKDVTTVTCNADVDVTLNLPNQAIQSQTSNNIPQAAPRRSLATSKSNNVNPSANSANTTTVIVEETGSAHSSVDSDNTPPPREKPPIPVKPRQSNDSNVTKL